MTTIEAPRRVPGRPATVRRGPARPRRTAFWVLALVLTVTMLGTTLPTPLYDIYQSRWHFVACYAGLIIPVVGVGVLAGFTGTFTAVLTFSVLLAALGLFSISRFVVRGAR